MDEILSKAGADVVGGSGGPLVMVNCLGVYPSPVCSEEGN